MDIKDFNIKCCEILKNIKEEDGLYGYYNGRIKKNEVLNIDDQLLIKYFLENGILSFKIVLQLSTSFLCSIFLT